ncbi:MAG: hypothetical protein HY253_14035 [Burkholderiales bacterium]|nr:hypothetical protein [Burkholderiales bacterium]
MIGERSKASLAREAKRNSPETRQFRNEIEHFLHVTNAEPNIAYFLRQDLKKMTDMAYYGMDIGHRTFSLKPTEIAIEYCNLLANFGTIEFTRKILKEISRQQNQTLRKLFLRPPDQIAKALSLGTKNGYWEHPIPLKFVRTELEKLIHCDLKKAHAFIDILQCVNQIFLSKEQNAVLNAVHKDSMPDGWKWDVPDSDLYIRYKVLDLNL